MKTARDSTPDWTQRRERGSRFALRFMVALSLWLGRRPSRLLVYFLAAFFCLFSPRERAALRRFYSHLDAARGAGWRRLYRHFLAFATVLHDRVFILNGQSRLFTITSNGEQALQALARERGAALIVSAHLGSFEMLKAFGEQHGQHVTMLMYEENSRRINASLAAINPQAKMPVIALNHLDSMLQARQHIEQGAWLGMLADRSLAADSKQAFGFLGQPALFGNGPWRLAALLGCPVFFMAACWQGGARYHIEIAPLADFGKNTSSRSERAQAVLAAQQHYVDLLQQMARRYPDNWFNFYDFWQGAEHEN